MSFRHLSLLISFICLHIFTLQASDDVLLLAHPRGNIEIIKIDNWEMAENVFGIPYIYFSPLENGQRSNISFTHTGLDFPFDENDLEGSLVEYRSLKQVWAKKVGAEIISFSNHELYETSQGHPVHQFSFSFRSNESQYIETSYYLACFEKMIFIKSLRLIQNTSHELAFTRLINSIRCQV